MIDVIELLQREFGAGHLIIDEDRLIPYGKDESDNGIYLPEAVFLPTDALQVEILCTLALQHKFCITPRGLGTGKSGGALPINGGVVISFEKMNHILDIDEESLFAVVEPGVITLELQKAALEQRLFYPPDPASLDQCSIGGNVAENAGGPRAFRYGVTREYLLGMEMVRMGGERFSIGKKSVKGVSGYDMTALMCGSEGTLGVFTRLIMKLIPSHRPSGIILAYYPSAAAAGKGISTLLKSGFFPMSLEMLDGTAIDHIRGIEGFNPPAGTQGAIICELEGLPEDDALLTSVADLFETTGITEMRAAMDVPDMNRVWEARRRVSTRLKEMHLKKLSEDIAVPRGAMEETLNIVSDIARNLGLESASYGHAGDGNLHVNFLSDSEDTHKNLERAVMELFVRICALGGTLSGEHGIGISKRKYMNIEHDPFSLKMMRQMKKAWDPHNLLNPGKIIPEGY